MSPFCRLPIGTRSGAPGGDPGIGAVAIAFALEGTDVLLSYLPDEQPDAQIRQGLRRS